MTEAELQAAVLSLARINGFLAMHSRPAQRAGGQWVTPISGDRGFPDLVLCGRGRVMFRELKSARGHLAPEQEVWRARLLAAGADYAVWRPEDWRSLKILADLQSDAWLRMNAPQAARGGAESRSEPQENDA